MSVKSELFFPNMKLLADIVGQFGVEYGSQCYCGNTLGGAAADEADCNMPCAADSTEKCGGPVRMSVYAVAGQV